MENKNVFVIEEELIQSEAESYLERELTAGELEEVTESIYENICDFLRDRIVDVVDFNELLERNKNAEQKPLHFDAWHRNENAYQPIFRRLRSFEREDDAREYVQHDFITLDDEWKIVRVENGTETMIWSINVK